MFLGEAKKLVTSHTNAPFQFDIFDLITIRAFQNKREY